MIGIDLDDLTNGTVMAIADDLGCEYDEYDGKDFADYIGKVKEWLEENYAVGLFV